MNSGLDISVIMPMYNAEKYIRETLASVLDQEPHGFSIEVVVVNDCSTDRSAEIVRSIRDERIVLIELKNKVGPSESRNTGLRHARGEWIEFLDSDDRISNDLLSKFRQCMDRESNLYLFGLVAEYPDHTLKQEIKNIRDKRVVGHFGIVMKYFIRKEICPLFEPGYLFEDMIFNMELMNAGELRMNLIRDAWYFYNRKNEESIISNFNENEFERTFDLCYSRLDNYDKLTRMYFLETYSAFLFDRSRPFWLSVKVATRTLMKLYPLLPALLFNTLKSQLRNEVRK